MSDKMLRRVKGGEWVYSPRPNPGTNLSIAQWEDDYLFDAEYYEQHPDEFADKQECESRGHVWVRTYVKDGSIVKGHCRRK